ncbi:hypothetical protein [Paraburkholderia piptadeniae]|uniref:hypothetical protein n=1 Tax=Paraburkholderia piptadeniae TaxID=1701573 RepID=UPI0013967488|nr:hypothetical protein [Paraburkholderia piptadeniae]
MYTLFAVALARAEREEEREGDEAQKYCGCHADVSWIGFLNSQLLRVSACLSKSFQHNNRHPEVSTNHANIHA